MNKPGFKQTPLGWIPEDWELNLLENLTKRSSGHTPDKEFDNYYNGGIKWISLADSNRLDKGLVCDTTIQISEDGLRNSSAVLLPKGTVVLSRDAGVGKSGVMAEAMAVSQHFITWTCEDKYDNWFLYYWLQFKKQYFEKQAVGSTIKTIGLPLFKKLQVINPPLPEQRRIAAILSTWDAAIVKEQQLIEALQTRHSALMQQLLTGKKRLRGFKGEWKEVRLGDVFTERNEIGCSDLPLLSITADRGVIYQSQNDKKNTSNEDKSKYRRICVGDIGYNTMRMWQGRSALSELEGIVSPAYTIITPNKDQLAAFYAALFKVPFMINSFFCHSQGLVEDTLNCKYKDFAIVKIKVPNIGEQTAIAEILTTSDQEIQIHRRHLAALQQQKKGLMQVLLTGKVRVKVTEL